MRYNRTLAWWIGRLRCSAVDRLRSEPFGFFECLIASCDAIIFKAVMLITVDSPACFCRILEYRKKVAETLTVLPKWFN